MRAGDRRDGVATSEDSMGSLIADRIVRERLSDGYESPDAGDLSGIELVPNILFRYPQVRDDELYNLQIYVGMGPLAGQLWEQEIRVLQRIGELNHPALPTIVEARFVEPAQAGIPELREGFGYIRTKADDGTIAEQGLTGDLGAHLRGDPGNALRLFYQLADALALLHDSKVAHRNVWPGSLQVRTGDRLELSFARFELSAMLSGLLDARSGDDEARKRVLGVYRDQGAAALVYSPPERLRLLLDEYEPGATQMGGPPSDVFGLGMMIAEWFLEPEQDDAPLTSWDELRSYQDRTRIRLTSTPTVPAALGTLLADMLAEAPTGRPLSAEVVERIGLLYDGAATILTGDTSDLPYLVIFQEKFTDRTLFKWGTITQSATTADGRKETRELIANDLTQAVVVKSEQGAVPYVSSGDEEDRRRATTVIFGSKFYWFCETYFLNVLGKREYLDAVQVIKYVVPKEKAPQSLKDLASASKLRRVLPMVEVIGDSTSLQLLRKKVVDRPDWKKLLDSIEERRPKSPAEQTFLDALDFVHQYDRARMRAREYAFTNETDSNRSEAVLRWDEARDRSRTNHLPALQSKLVGNRKLRPSFADYFAESDDEDHTFVEVEVLTDRRNGPGDTVAHYQLKAVRGNDEIVLDTRGAPRVPPHGWVRLSSDRAIRTAHQRQLEARGELQRSRLLLAQIVGTPATVTSRVGRDPYATVLEGSSADAVHEMLDSEVMLVVQGPPGTGKTEITAEAVTLYLRRHPAARVLVSAQSHDALDNLATRILRKLDILTGDLDDIIPVRLASSVGRQRISDEMQPFLPEQLVDRYVESIRRNVVDRLRAGALSIRLREVAQAWLKSVERSVLELDRRLTRGANLVFVTCGGATQRVLVEEGSADLFDWVVVEEAAKAWPTELAMPLVRGRRWTLVGDHAQIGAFGRADVSRFLDTCRDDPNPAIDAHYQRKVGYLEAFDMFGSMFQRRAPGAGARQLSDQYRMRHDIARVVGEVFYPAGEPDAEGRTRSSLETRRADSDHGFEYPEWLRDEQLVWIDTDGVFAEEGFWSNENEASLVAKVIRALEPVPNLTAEAPGVPDLAIITPYRKQVDVISRAIPEAARFVSTIDSFQGREARIVVLSLVRDTPKTGSPTASIGHLAEPARANVALSRARDLLVIVGRLAHYEATEVPEWRGVARIVRETGVVISAGRVV